MVFFLERTEEARSAMIDKYGDLKKEFEKHIKSVIMRFLTNSKNTGYNVTSSSRFKSSDRILEKICDKKDKGAISTVDFKKSDYTQLILDYVTDFIGFRFIIGQGDTDYQASENNYFDKTIRNLNPIQFLDLFYDATMSEYNRNIDILYFIENLLKMEEFSKFKFVGKDGDKYSCEYKIVDIKDFIESPKEDSGYASLHLIVEISFSKKGKSKKKIKTEIQLCNLLQHIYAEFEHKRYEKDLPEDKKIPVDIACSIAQILYDDKFEFCKLDRTAIFLTYYVCMEILNGLQIDSSILYGNLCAIFDDKSPESAFLNKEKAISKIIGNNEAALKKICELCYNIIVNYEISKYKESYTNLNDELLYKAFEDERRRVADLLLGLADKIYSFGLVGAENKLGYS